MADAASSTSPSNETVSLKLPSGEMVDAVVPSGMSDSQVSLLMKMKRPDLMVPKPPTPEGLQPSKIWGTIPRLASTEATADAYSNSAILMLGGGLKNVGEMPKRPALPESTAPEATTSPVQVGKLPKETSNPYAGSRVPSSMEMVDSTNVTKIGYHPDSKTMMVEYRNGRVYEYRGVPEEIANQAKESESVGSFISRNVKGRYETNYRGSVLGKR